MSVIALLNYNKSALRIYKKNQHCLNNFRTTLVFITEIHVEINTEFYTVKCDYNLIQYQILHASLQNFIFMERSACHKMFSNGQNFNSSIFLHVHLRLLQTVF